jgi:hypothetical protein
MSNTNIREMNTQSAYKKIPVIYKKDKDGIITKTIYPVYYNLQKEKHLENYRSTLSKIFYKALIKRFSDPFEKKVIEHIYDTYHNEYKFDIDEITIEKLNDNPIYNVFIENDKWSVSYEVEIQLYGDPLRNRLQLYINENLCYFQSHSIWIHLEGKSFADEEKEASSFEDTDTKCPICLEDYDDEKEHTSLHNCGHKYCVDCVDQVIEYGSCGICRMTTDINEDPIPITKEDIENLCEDEDSETLVNWLKHHNEYNNFCNYVRDSDGYTHILGFESGTDIEMENGDEYILMCRLDEYEKKTPINPYNM